MLNQLFMDMIQYYEGDEKRIQHFVKVHAFAKFEEKLIKRVCYLVGHHHTYTDIDGIDYQILVEADCISIIL